MSDAKTISSETLEVLRTIPTQTLIDGLWVMGWPMSYIHGAKPLQQGQHMSGRAVTLRFVPHRPDLVADKPKGVDSAEYVAIELCGPEEILVIDAMGWEYSSIGGDIKFLRMMQLNAGGLVTDVLPGTAILSRVMVSLFMPPTPLRNKARRSFGLGRSTTPSSAVGCWSGQVMRWSATMMAWWWLLPLRWMRSSVSPTREKRSKRLSKPNWRLSSAPRENTIRSTTLPGSCSRKKLERNARASHKISVPEIHAMNR